MEPQPKRYSVRISRTTAKEFKRVPEPYKERLAAALRSLENEPHAGKALKGELVGLHSLRVLPYRIMYRGVGKERMVEVLDMGHRQGIYKNLRP